MSSTVEKVNAKRSATKNPRFYTIILLAAEHIIYMFPYIHSRLIPAAVHSDSTLSSCCCMRLEIILFHDTEHCATPTRTRLISTFYQGIFFVKSTVIN